MGALLRLRQRSHCCGVGRDGLAPGVEPLRMWFSAAGETRLGLVVVVSLDPGQNPGRGIKEDRLALVCRNLDMHVIG